MLFVKNCCSSTQKPTCFLLQYADHYFPSPLGSFRSNLFAFVWVLTEDLQETIPWASLAAPRPSTCALHGQFRRRSWARPAAVSPLWLSPQSAQRTVYSGLLSGLQVRSPGMCCFCHARVQRVSNVIPDSPTAIDLRHSFYLPLSLAGFHLSPSLYSSSGSKFERYLSPFF